MKVKASIKKRSEDCKIVKRKGKLYVICKKNPKFKMRHLQRPKHALGQNHHTHTPRRCVFANVCGVVLKS